MSDAKILFLDIDGTFNHYYSSKRFDLDEFVEIDGLEVFDFSYDKRLLKNVYELCKRYDMKIVLSSDWRNRLPIKFMQKIFNKIGLQIEIVGYTSNDKLDDEYFERKYYDPKAVSHLRGEQITQYIKKYNVKKYLVLDDNIYAKYGHDEFFIKCDREHGFTDKLFKQTIEKYDSEFM